MDELSDSAETRARLPSSGAGPATAPARFTPGTVLADRYRIVSPLGRGGMGDVYRADDLRLGQTVALKFLPTRVARDPEKLRRLYDEVRVGRQVSHPNVCRLYDVVEWEGDAFITMEYIDGEDLASLLRRIGKLPHLKALTIAREIAFGLAAAHALGIIHRDLKPANVMIDGRGTARITDFGLAVVAEELTSDGAIIGTPAYMAPEQLAGQPATPKTDLYALGVTTYEIFTGKRRFEGRTLDEIRSEHGSNSQVSRETADLDPAMQRVILRCLEEDPARRPSSIHAVIAAMPGGDPLQAAIDAGETPSPEMLAAAGESGELKPSVAWPLFMATMLMLAVCYALVPRSNFNATVRLSQSPEALAFRARELVRMLAPDARARDSCHWYRVTIDDYQERRKFAGSADRATALRPTAGSFYYRQSPRPMLPIGRGFARRENDPPFTIPAMASVTLDPDGHLLEFRRLPAQIHAAAAPAEVDWTRVLQATDLVELQSVTPLWAPTVGSDRRYAWTGIYPGQKDVPIRVEAASHHGTPVWLDVIPPWRKPVAPDSPEQPLMVRVTRVTSVLTQIVIVLASIILARRNIRRGRADAKAATRVALFVLALIFAGRLLSGDHATDPQYEFLLVMNSFAMALWTAVIVWASYAALEPYLRRRWPRSLIGWRRLIDGRFSDAMVGRETLTGMFIGALLVLIALGRVPLASLLGRTLRPASPVALAIEGPLHFFVLVPAGLSLAIIKTLGLAVLLLVIHVVMRNRAATVTALAILFALIAGWVPVAGDTVIDIMGNLAIGSVLALTLTRRGIYTMIVALIAVILVFAPPVTLDTSAWFFWRGAVAMVLAAALTIYGFVMSFGAQPIFSGAVLDD